MSTVAPFTDWQSLPKFLLCDQNLGADDDRIFVLHTHKPRFLMEFVGADEGDFFLIDPPTSELPALKEAARVFFSGGVGD